MTEETGRGVTRLRIEDMERPVLDDRSYRTITLPNQLEVLLVHDAKAGKASAALDVNLGSFSDVETMPGIAHAIEHLLFMDSEKYPEENNYKKYLAQKSSHSNAYADLLSTNYYFELAASQATPPFAQTNQRNSPYVSDPINDSPKPTPVASPVEDSSDSEYQRYLDRLSQLVLEDSIDLLDEPNNASSKNGRNLQMATWRLHQLNKALSDSQLPVRNLYARNEKIRNDLMKYIDTLRAASALANETKPVNTELETFIAFDKWMRRASTVAFTEDSHRRPKMAAVEVFEIPSVLHVSGHKRYSSALGDYCARYNFMKAEHAAKLRLPIDRSETRNITIGSGKTVRTTGTVQATFQFADEPSQYDLKFHVLASCVQDVILGKPFLKATRTLSSAANRARRITRRVIEGISRHRLFFLGGSAPTFTGLVNGRTGDALADSGSSVLVMDEDYAEGLGLPIQRGDDCRTRLLFADGSSAYTSGVTQGVRWQFGLGGDTKEHFLDFHVLKNAPAKLILSDSFLFKTEAYSKYDCYLLDDEEEEYYDEDTYFFTISHDPSYQNRNPVDMSTIANMEYKEQCDRSRIEDDIARLPKAEQEGALARELERQSKWEQDMDVKRRQLAASQAQASSQHQNPSQRPSTTAFAPPSNRPPVENLRPNTQSDVSNNSGQFSRPFPKRFRFPLRFKVKRRSDQ